MDPAQVAAYAAQFQSQLQQPLPSPQPLQQQQQQQFSPVNSLPSHPSYPEMIIAAISWENNQGKVTGSSKRAIEKYINRVYTDLPPTHSALLSHNLQRLKSSGQVVMIKNSYQLPSFTTTTTTTTVTPTPAAAVIDDSEPYVPRSASPLPQFQQQHQGVVPLSYVSPKAEISNSDTPRKKRGRPPKLAQFQPQTQEVVGNGNGNGNGGSSTGKRPRGRPPKEVVVPFVQPISEVVSNGNGNDNGNVSGNGNGNVSGNGNGNGSVSVSLSGKRRGRPPKKQQEVRVGQQMGEFQVDLGSLVVEERKEASSVSGKRRGRPPKKLMDEQQHRGGGGGGGGFQVELVDGGVNSPVYEEVEMPVSVGKKRDVMGVGVGRGGPKMNVGSNVVAGIVEGDKKKRGWPKGKPRGKKGFVGFTMAKYLGKKRGRKPKSSLGVVGKVEKKVYNGKPRGRKKKSATSGQGLETANEELQRKLEDMQSKLKDAVRLIKPHLAYPSPPDALSALQQLEDLSTMSLTQAPALVAPPVNEVPMDVTAPPQNTSAPNLTAPTIAPNLTAPTMTAFTASQEMNVPLPYGMNVTLPYQAPIIENQQPLSWIPSNGAQL